MSVSSISLVQHHLKLGIRSTALLSVVHHTLQRDSLRGGEGMDRSKPGKAKGKSFANNIGKSRRGTNNNNRAGDGGSKGFIPPSHGQIDSPLEDFLGQEVHVQMAGGQEYRGRLRGYDGFGNIVLDNSTEYVMEQLDDPDSTVWTGQTVKCKRPRSFLFIPYGLCAMGVWQCFRTT
jgi:small nuclear ribonucleoprotein (snRNP)-like protein